MPTSVTASGLTPRRSSRLPTGLNTPVQNARISPTWRRQGIDTRLPAQDRRTVAGRSHSGFQPGSHHERQVAAAGHVQEVRQVHQGEARREAREGRPAETLMPPGKNAELSEEVTAHTLPASGSSDPPPRRTSTGCRSTPTTCTRIDAELAAPDHARARVRRAVRRSPTATWRRTSPASRRATRSSPAPTSCCCPSRSSRTSPRCSAGQVLWGWPHCVQDPRADPARDRPRA